MKLVLFHQYDQLLAKIREVARCCARDAADWKICRVSASSGSVHLHDRAMNVLSVSGGETRIVVPDIEPERANIPQSEGLPRSGAQGCSFVCASPPKGTTHSLSLVRKRLKPPPRTPSCRPRTDRRSSIVLPRRTKIVSMWKGWRSVMSTDEEL